MASQDGYWCIGIQKMYKDFAHLEYAMKHILYKT